MSKLRAPAHPAVSRVDVRRIIEHWQRESLPEGRIRHIASENYARVLKQGMTARTPEPSAYLDRERPTPLHVKLSGRRTPRPSPSRRSGIPSFGPPRMRSSSIARLLLRRDRFEQRWTGGSN